MSVDDQSFISIFDSKQLLALPNIDAASKTNENTKAMYVQAYKIHKCETSLSRLKYRLDVVCRLGRVGVVALLEQKVSPEPPPKSFSGN
jgi:hypothetical protein